MIVGFVKETFNGERRVAVVPNTVPSLTKAGCEVIFEAGAGLDAGFEDSAYVEKNAKAVSRQEAITKADVLLLLGEPDGAG